MKTQGGLPDNLKSGIENLSGVNMDQVKVHYNSQKPAQLNALAYAHGSQIHMGPGVENHLPHEAWHVVQQSQGRAPGLPVEHVLQANGISGKGAGEIAKGVMPSGSVDRAALGGMMP